MAAHLDQSCTKHAGSTLVLKPLHGWGWWRDNQQLGTDEYARIEAAGSVIFRVVEFVESHGELRHIIGRVEGQHDIFAGLWITCAVMQTGTFDFRHKLCMRYDTSLGPLAPQGRWPLAGGSPRWEGYGGIVGESEQFIDEYLAILTQGT